MSLPTDTSSGKALEATVTLCGQRAGDDALQGRAFHRERWTDTQRCVQKAQGKGSPSRRPDSHQQLAEEGKRLSQRLQRHAACQHTGSVSDTNFKLQAPRLMKGHMASGVDSAAQHAACRLLFFCVHTPGTQILSQLS